MTILILAISFIDPAANASQDSLFLTPWPTGWDQIVVSVLRISNGNFDIKRITIWKYSSCRLKFIKPFTSSMFFFLGKVFKSSSWINWKSRQWFKWRSSEETWSSKRYHVWHLIERVINDLGEEFLERRDWVRNQHLGFFFGLTTIHFSYCWQLIRTFRFLHCLPSIFFFVSSIQWHLLRFHIVNVVPTNNKSW